MDELRGLWYVRMNEWYEQRYVEKHGITAYGKDRDGVYVTGEPKRGKFVFGIEVLLKYLRVIDHLIMIYLAHKPKLIFQYHLFHKII